MAGVALARTVERVLAARALDKPTHAKSADHALGVCLNSTSRRRVLLIVLPPPLSITNRLQT